VEAPAASGCHTEEWWFQAKPQEYGRIKSKLAVEDEPSGIINDLQAIEENLQNDKRRIKCFNWIKEDHIVRSCRTPHEKENNATGEILENSQQGMSGQSNCGCEGSRTSVLLAYPQYSPLHHKG